MLAASLVFVYTTSEMPSNDDGVFFLEEKALSSDEIGFSLLPYSCPSSTVNALLKMNAMSGLKSPFP